MSNKIKKRNKFLANLKLRNVIILEEHIDKIILAETEFNLSTMVNKYKRRFLFQWDPYYYKRGVYLLSIIQIAKFDHYLACFLNCEISKIEKDFTDILIEQINIYLNLRIFNNKQEDDLNELDLPIKELIKGNNRKIFLRLFNKQEAKIRKDIFNFLEYIAKNNKTIDTKLSVHNLFTTFIKEREEKENTSTNVVNKQAKNTESCDSNKENDKKLKKTEKIITNILKTVSDKSGLSLTETLLGLSLNIKKFFELYEEYSLDDILNRFADSLNLDEIITCSVSKAADSWSLGTKIDIFDSLNEDVKAEITNEFFDGLDIVFKKYKKSTVFIQILRFLKKVRNKCSHTNIIYDFITKNNSENLVIIKFLESNKIYGVNSLNKIRICGAIECIALLNGKNLERREEIKQKVISMLNEINLELLPDDIRSFIKKQFKIDG